MEPITLEELPENALLLIDSAPIIYVLEDHPEQVLDPAIENVDGMNDSQAADVRDVHLNRSSSEILGSQPDNTGKDRSWCGESPCRFAELNHPEGVSTSATRDACQE